MIDGLGEMIRNRWSGRPIRGHAGRCPRSPLTVLSTCQYGCSISSRAGYAVVFIGIARALAVVPGGRAAGRRGVVAPRHLSLGWVIVIADRRDHRRQYRVSDPGGGWRLPSGTGGRFVDPARLQEFDRFFARHGAKTVFIARFVTGLRVSGGAAGGSGTSWKTFLIFNATGAVAGQRLWRWPATRWRTLGGLERWIGRADFALVVVVILGAIAMMRARQERKP
jgi:hypothetical protein